MTAEIFRDMVEGASVGFFALDGKGRLLYLNRSLAELFGYAVEELRGACALRTLVHPDDRDRVKREAERLLRGDLAFVPIYFRGLRKDGGKLDCEALVWTVGRGTSPLLVGNLLDATEKLSSQRKLALIREWGQTAITLRDVRQVARALVEAVQEVIGVRTCGIWLLQGDKLVRIAHSLGWEEARLSVEGERGIIAATVREKRAIYVPDTEREPRYLRGKLHTRSEFCVPLVARGKVLGALNAEKGEVDGFTPADRELLESLAALAAIALDNALQFERERKMFRQLKLINEVALRTVALRQPGELYRSVVESIVQQFRYYSVALFTVEGDEAVLRAIAGELAGAVRPGGYRQAKDVGIIGQVLRTGRTYLAPDVTRDPYYIRGYAVPVRVRSELCVPVKRDDRVVGVLDIQSQERGAFGEADVEAMEAVARWVAVALENAELYRKLQGALQNTAATLAEAVEIRDPYTAGHQLRVATLAVALARELGLEPERVEAVRLAAQLHDIGKIAVPAEVLNKPGRLGELEMRLVQKHPEAAYKVLRGIPFPYPVAEIVWQHHERLDGSGYPRGLKGDEISLEARILAVADVVEAMCSHRPYRPPHPLEEVLEELQRGKGRLYDPQVVEACIRLLREGRFRFPDPLRPAG